MTAPDKRPPAKMPPAKMPPDWPFRTETRRVNSRPHDWCVADLPGPAPDAPVILCLHGAGGAGHSFRALAPLLQQRFRVVIPDLPGQGFTRAGARRFGLDTMAEDLATLCQTMGIAPAVVLGHSAGAAIALRLAEMMPLSAVVGINAALGTFDGAAGVMFPLLARILAVTPFIPHVVARLWGNPQTVAKLLTSTGSPLDAEGQAQYLTLVRDAAHVDGTLGMMAQWRLEGLMDRLPQLATPTLLIASDKDNAVPASVSRDAALHMPAVTYAEIAGYGHLVHEEAAEAVAAVLLPWLSARL